jgi:lysine 6-dehydrogenase
MTKAQLALSSRFEKIGRTAITGCGSTPGINNIMLKHGIENFQQVETVELGFAWDSNVKKFVAPFSIESVIEELTEPASVLEDGAWIERIPRETEIQRQFREIGLQKCYLVNHPETYTFFSDYAKKYGIRNIRFWAGFPNHSVDVLERLIELGLGEKDLLHFEKVDIRPVDAVSRILTRLHRPDGYTEQENLWVEISGRDNSGNIKITKMECLANTLPGWEDAGCNIDTGFPASIMAQMVLDGRVPQKGSFTPDEVVPVNLFFEELKKKGLVVFQDGIAIS